jgi:hypothetical protein
MSSTAKRNVLEAQLDIVMLGNMMSGQFRGIASVQLPSMLPPVKSFAGDTRCFGGAL